MDQIEVLSTLEIFEQETRQEIISSLLEKGSQRQTLRELSSNLNAPIQTLLWHLRVLEEYNFIIKKKIQNELVFIVREYLEDFDDNLKNFELSFKTESAKKFYSFLINLQEEQVFTLSDIINHTSWSSRTSLRYVRKLTVMGIIEKNQNGRGYKINKEYYLRIKNKIH